MNPTESDQPLAWSDRLLLGHSPMDDTHREFVEVVGLLQVAAEHELAERLENVLIHLERHFREEDTWMRDTSYPAADCHVDEHAAVRASGQEVKEMLANGNSEPCRRYADELAKWFPGHADYLDAPLAQWLSRKRFGGTPVVIKRGVAHAE
ncbi:bacteriohemerythrin [Ottowia sp. VDI28]|uniref:bacteriohemerythrin n=1 Tax=Ottowia sp. VDI28 TaxID=3133968 RepID=UPI003C2B2A6D